MCFLRFTSYPTRLSSFFVGFRRRVLDSFIVFSDEFLRNTLGSCIEYHTPSRERVIDDQRTQKNIKSLMQISGRV